MVRIGPFDIYSIPTGSLRLDGGAMFGVVPKVLWAQTAPPDERNRISLATRTLLAVDWQSRRVVLTDTGCGTKWSPNEAAKYDVHYDHQAIPNALHALGLTVEDVTDVVVTHLHFDHNGGLTDWYDDPGGPTVQRFKNARHWIHRRHWDHACNPHIKDRPSFFKADYESIAESGLFQFVEGDAPAGPFEGLEWCVSHGHTPFHLHPKFRDGKNSILFVGDLVPTVAHLRPAWVMAYDMQPRVTIDEKYRVFQEALKDGGILAFAHDPATPAVRIDGTPDRPIVCETPGLDLPEYFSNRGNGEIISNPP